MGQDDEEDAQMLQAKQQLTNNVINKRKDQLRRWQSSEMNAEPIRRTKRSKVQFQDSDIFLSACMSGDEEEVDELLAKGADINTCTVDGLTALHQSVIDSKPEMVRYLCEKGADVNAQDNEGWTPLHAAACCGNVAIIKYLCEHGADLSIVNSDKELALDLADDEQCREFLDRDYRRQKIDVEACRDKELNTMLSDAKVWLNSGEYRDIPHHRTGGTAMHVAAARGYIQLLELLIKAGGNVKAKDKDGWTPLHAAAHWAEKDACKILIENGSDLSDTTYAGQDVLSVADKEIGDYLVELGEAARHREKRKSPSQPPVSVLGEKNHRMAQHEDHIMPAERKRDIQHKDQHSENEFLHHRNSPAVVGEVVEDEVEEEGEEEEEVEEEEEMEEEEVEDESSEKVSESLRIGSESQSASVTPRTSEERSTSIETSETRSSSLVTNSNSSSRTRSETPASSSSIGSGDQNVSATIPIVPSSAPPKALHQSPSSWINRGFPLATRGSSSSVSRSSSTPATEIISPPGSLHSQTSVASSSNAMPKNGANSPGTVTISATFTKPSVPSDMVQRSPSTSVPWASLWQNVNNASTGQIRQHIEQLQNASSSPSLSQPRVSAFRPPQPRNIRPDYPRGLIPQQIDPLKMSRWQSKTVNESEAERRNNSRMQRQHRRSTQGVTKEQLEEASRFANDEMTRRNSSTITSSPASTVVRLASEENDLSSTSSNVGEEVTTTATVALNVANVRRKSQGLGVSSRSNRRATGPVNPEDLAQAGGRGLRLAYSPASVRSVAGTIPTTTTRVAEKAQSLPPSAVNNVNALSQPISSRSAVVAGLSPAPPLRSSGNLSSAAPISSRYGASSSLSSNASGTAYSLNNRPTETNLNYKALYEKERAECDRLRREVDEMRRAQTVDNWRGSATNGSSSSAWRMRNASPATSSSSQPNNHLSVAKSTSLASFDDNERRSMERKIADLEMQLKTATNLRMENQRLKEENGALVRVISKMTI